MPLETSAPKAQDALYSLPPFLPPRQQLEKTTTLSSLGEGSSVLYDTQLVVGKPDTLTSVPVFSILGKEVKMHGVWEFPGGWLGL